jgi:hypothetical protein
MMLNGNITLTMGNIGTVGSCGSGGRSCESGNITLSPTPVGGIVPYSDPLSFVPQFTCNTSSCTNGTTTVPCNAALSYVGSSATPISLNHGCYNGLSAVGNYTFNLQPGTYIFNGGLSLNGNINFNGSGVTIYIPSGSMNFVGNAVLNLSAPTSGTYDGILFAQSSSDTSAENIVGNAGSVLKGIMYFPGTSLTMTGNGSTSLYTDFVAQSLSFIGNVSFQDYAALPGVTSPLSSVVLVE